MSDAAQADHALLEEVRRLSDAVARLGQENQQLRARLDALDPPAATASSPGAAPAPGDADADTDGGATPIGRRRLLRDGLVAGAAATATAAAGLAGASPVAADTGDALILGADNSAGTATSLNAPGGFYVNWGTAAQTHYGGAAVGGIHGPSGGLGGIGVSAHTDDDGFAGLAATGPVAGRFESKKTHLLLETPNGGNRFAPVFDPVAHQRGEVVASTSGGELWWCVASGSPGEWRKLSGASTAGAFHLLPAPVRVYDSRPGTTPAQGPKTRLAAGNVARALDMSHNSSGVPKGTSPYGGRIAASGVLLNVLLVEAAAGDGNFTVWANDQPKPQSNTLVWGGSAGRFSTLAVSAVDVSARVKVAASLSTHVVLDVVGYYR